MFSQCQTLTTVSPFPRLFSLLCAHQIVLAWETPWYTHPEALGPSRLWSCYREYCKLHSSYVEKDSYLVCRSGGAGRGLFCFPHLATAHQQKQNVGITVLLVIPRAMKKKESPPSYPRYLFFTHAGKLAVEGGKALSWVMTRFSTPSTWWPTREGDSTPEKQHPQ